jgi:hypothetical protein
MKELFKKFLFTLATFMFVALPLTVVNAQTDEAESPDYTTTSTDMTYEDFDWDTYYDEISDTVDDYSYTTTTDLDAEDAAAFALFGTAIMGVVLIGSITVGLVMYIYMSVTLMKVAQKLNHENPWFAWIPILNAVLLFQLGEQNPWLLLLVLIPGLGALIVGVISIIALMKICEKRGYDKLLGLLYIVPIANLVLLGMLAWGKKESVNTEAPATV